MPDDVIARTDLTYRTAFWAERIADPEWPVYLIEEEGQGVAFCQMIPTKDPDDEPARVGHITSLHVLPNLRGHGYGRTLMDHVCAEFRRRGFAEVTLWVLYVGGAPAGYFELYAHADCAVEVAYFGLLPEFKRRSLGKYLLSVATEKAWTSGARRVWLHTCTLDDPAALPNYLARGFRPFREETYWVDAR